MSTSQLIVNYDVMWDAKEVKIVAFGKSGTGFRFSRTPRFSVKERKKKSSLIVTFSWRHELPFDIYPKEVINHAKFDVCKPCSFGGIKTNRQTELLFLY